MIISSNETFNSAFKRANSAAPISREKDIFINISNDHMTKAWNQLCGFILKNYHSGKGTSIPKFGVFTYQNPLFSLEGTTNQVSRDLKSRIPVFIVSSDFVQNVKPGVYSENGTITHYEQRLNNNINTVKINYSEIAISMSISKAECSTIIDNLILFLGDRIRDGKLKNKELPGIGSLILKGNLLSVKFLPELCLRIMDYPQRLTETKKHVHIVNDLANNNQNQLKSSTNKKEFGNINSHTNDYNYINGIRNLPSLSKSIANLRPNTSLLTKITPKGCDFLLNNMNINVDQLKNEENEDVFVSPPESDCLYNDMKKNKLELNRKLSDLHIKNSILEDIIYQKAYIISQMKKYDSQNKGQLKKESIKTAIKSAKIDGLSDEMINEILLIYIKSSSTNGNSQFNSEINPNTFRSNDISKSFNSARVDSIGYNDLMLLLIKDIKDILVISSKSQSKLSKNENFNKTFSKNSVTLTESIQKSSEDKKNMKNKAVPCLDKVKTEIITIKTIASQLKERNSIMLNQLISSMEFTKMLREYQIIYPIEKINEILSFLEIDHKFFTLKSFFNALNNCKILVSETLTEEILKAIKQIKDIVYVNGGEGFFFEKGNESITKDEFISKVKSKTRLYSENLLIGVYYYITKMDRNMTISDFSSFFTESKKESRGNILDIERFIQQATEEIISKMSSKNMKEEEYFDRFLRFKNNRNDNYLNKYDLHFSFKKENFQFSAEEVDLLFEKIDSKCDGVIDRKEFTSFLKIVHDPVFKLQDIIKKYNLEIEEILFRMNIDVDKPEVLDFYAFKSKMLLLNSGFSHDFIFSIYLKIKNANDTVDTKDIIKMMNVYKKENFNKLNTSSFKKNFLEYYRSNGSLKEMKEAFEKIDTFCNGFLNKVDFCNVIKKFNKQKSKNEKKSEKNLVFQNPNSVYEEYKDEDIMKICRIFELYAKDEKVNYTKFLEILYYNKENNKFNSISHFLCDLYKKYEIEKLKDKTEIAKSAHINFYSIDNPVMSNILSHLTDGASKLRISICEFIKKIEKLMNLDSVPTSIAQMFDIDKDGYISQDDLKSIIDRYMKNHFFKYEEVNPSPSNINPNFYCKEELSEERFKLLVKDIKSSMKLKNLTEVGLFNKLDTNKDGFITSPEFNSNIDQVFKMASNIKDQFYSFLDIRKLGLVDLDTFLKRFKDFSSNDIIVKNDWEIEEKIIISFKNFLMNDCLKRKLTIYEIFALLDYNVDGKICIDDFKKFVLERLLFSPYEINTFKIERVIQHISQSKINFMTIHDIKEYINDFVTEKNPISKGRIEMNKETYNLNKDVKGVEWINSVFEKFGLFITEKYSSFEKFFEAINEKNINSEKIKIDDFMRFINKNHLSLEGFNLTKDELIKFFAAFDSHKKSYITLADVKSKLSDFDFYRKMKESIRKFFKNNFKNGAEGFIYFIEDKNIRESSQLNKVFLTKKEMFNGINNLFPNTYTSENILSFIKKTFTSSENISYSEFNFVFFDEISDNNELNKFGQIKKNDYSVFGRLSSNTSSQNTKLRANSAHVYSKKSSNPKEKLVTPYDEDSLEKLRRLLKSSRFNYSNFFNMYDILNNGVINIFEFRNMIKKLNIGLTALEIDEIISKSGKNREGLINMKDFLRFINYEDVSLIQITTNLKSFMADLKQLIYKYYANPRLAYQFNDKFSNNEMTLDRFKNIVNELYEKEKRSPPNYSIIKNCFEYIDLRKDNVIDINEWSKSFSNSESILDPKGKCQENTLNSLREWESSKDITLIFEVLSKNRKLIKDISNKYLFYEGIHQKIFISDLIKVMNSVLSSSNHTLSKTQWKMLAAFADKDKTGMIDFEEFMMIVNNSAKTTKSQPKLIKV